jgi:hypothetical protein
VRVRVRVKDSWSGSRHVAKQHLSEGEGTRVECLVNQGVFQPWIDCPSNAGKNSSVPRFWQEVIRREIGG